MQAAFMDMRLPTPSQWVPTDAAQSRTPEQRNLGIAALLAAVKRMRGLQNGGRMAAGAIKAAVNGDRNFYHDLHRLVSRGHMKRETLLGHYVYSLDTKAARIERERKRAQRKALELQKKETAKRAAAIKAQKARTARIAKLRREIACRQAALQRLGC